MKLGTASIDGVDTVVVAVDDDHVAVLDGGGAPADVASLVADWPTAADRVAGSRVLSVADLTWRPPVVRPGKVICVALNNSANRDRILSGPDHPATFLKPASSLVGHLQPIRLRADYGRVHPEPELAVVVGRGGSDLRPEDALDHVFGYTIFNDLTAPTLRGEDTFHYRAIHPGEDGGVRYVESWVSYSGRYKGSDTFGPIGPWVVTRDEVPDPHALTVRCVHQGRLVTEDSTANLRHSVTDVLSFISRWMTLEAGDVVAMGTALAPAASQAGGAVQNVDLTLLGGPIEVSISGIGTLRNPVELR